MAKARRAVRLCARARVVGVAFWDFFHGQTGVAPSAIELHPILGFARLSGWRRRAATERRALPRIPARVQATQRPRGRL